MRHFRFILLLSFFIADFSRGYAASPPLLEWQKCLGGSSQDMPVHLIKGTDGYIYTLGSTSSIDGDVSSNNGSLDLWLTKQDSTGNLIWQRTYGGSGIDVGTGIVEVSGGNFVLGGYTASSNGDVSSNHGNFDAWILKINAQGNIIWEKTIGGSQVDLSYTLLATQDGGFILGGGTYSNDGNVSGNHGDQDFWIVKVNGTGTLVWQRSLGGTGLDVCYSVVENSAGELIACGSTNSTNGNVVGNHGTYDFWVNKLSPNGSLIWSKTLGGSLQEAALSIALGVSGEYAIAGYSKSTDGDLSINYGYNDFWICILNENGSVMKKKVLGGSGTDIVYNVISTQDGGYLLSGGTTSLDRDIKTNHGAEDILLIKIDSNLSIEWSQTYGGSSNDRPSCAIQNADGGFYISSYTYSTDGDVQGNHGTSDFWILKLSCRVPTSYFLPSTDSICVNNLLSFSNNSLNATAYSWSLNNRLFSDLENPVLQLTRHGNNVIKLKTETCYNSDEYQKQVYLSTKPTVQIISSAAYICSGASIDLSSSTNGYYSWSGGSTTPSIQISQGGQYQLSLRKGGCTVLTSINVIEHIPPAISLGADTNICSGTSLLLSAPANMSNYIWQDGSNLPYYLVTMSGTYQVTASDQYCSSTDAINVSLLNCGAPQANFSASTQEICADGTVSFQDLSGNASSWAWSFPGGQPATSSDQNPLVTYPTSGVYAVMLQASNQAGSNNIMRVQFITVNPNPAKPTITQSGNFLSSSHAENYQWKLNMSNISGAIYQTYSASQSGNYQIEITDYHLCKAISDPIMVLITGMSSMKATGQGLKVFPNPTYGDVQIQTEIDPDEEAEIRLFDTNASLLYSNRLAKGVNGMSTTLDLSNLPSGTYFLEYRTQSGQVTGSILIKQ